MPMQNRRKLQDAGITRCSNISVAYCPKPSSPDNGICTSKNPIYGGKRKCICNHGFKFSDGNLTKEATCTVEKNVAIWSRPRPSCKGRIQAYISTLS